MKRRLRLWLLRKLAGRDYEVWSVVRNDTYTTGSGVVTQMTVKRRG